MSLINFEKLLSEFSGDEEILFEIIEIFLKEVPRMCQNIHDSVINLDGKGVEHAAHALKGAVSNFHAVIVKDQASMIEKAGRENQLANVKEDFEILSKNIDALVIELKNFRIPGKEALYG